MGLVLGLLLEKLNKAMPPTRILALTLTLALTPTSTQPLPLPLPYPYPYPGDHSLCYSNLTAPTRKEKVMPLVQVEDVLIGPVSEVFRRNGIAAQSSDGASCFSNPSPSPSPNPSALALALAPALTLASTLSLTRRQLFLSRAR